MTPEFTDELTKTFFELVRPDMTVLDLGAGAGKYARRLAVNGVKVVAVDRRADPGIKGVVWHEKDVRDWLASSEGESYDAAFMRNVIQFFDKEYVVKILLPTVASRILPGGVIAIQTFFADPEPPFPRPMTSYWTVEELSAAFPGWTVVRAERFSDRRMSLVGNDHVFHLSDLIVRKP